jgi:hypothetical protein
MDFEWQTGDGSNSFHPSSGPEIKCLIDSCFIPMACYLIEQARHPNCLTVVRPVGADYIESVSGRDNLSLDYGIVAAKIVKGDENAPGALNSFTTSLRETTPGSNSWVVYREAYNYLFPGEYQLCYWVQNNSIDARYRQSTCRVTLLREWREWTWDGSARWMSLPPPLPEQTFMLETPQREMGTFEFTAEHGKEYRLTLQVQPVAPAPSTDDLPENDVRVFTFTSLFAAELWQAHLDIT